MDPTATSAKCNRILHQPGFPAVGLNLRDTDNLSPSTPKDSYRTRQSKKNSIHCSIFGINGKIDPLSDADDFDEEVIYSQESPKMEEIFSETLTRIWIGLLSTDRLSQEKKHYQLKKHFRF